MKRRKLQHGPLPMDCVGEVISFISSTKTFFKVYTINHHSKWYFDEENPNSLDGITFETSRSQSCEVSSEKKYVTWLIIRNEIRLIFFPRVKRLVLRFGFSRFISELPSLKYCEEVVVRSFVFNDDLIYFSNLKRAKFDSLSAAAFTDDGVKNLKSVELLHIDDSASNEPMDPWSSFSLSFCSDVTGECFPFMPELRELNVSGCSGLIGENFVHLPKLKVLIMAKIENNARLTENCLAHLKEIEVINLANCGVSDEGLKLLPTKLLREIWPAGNARITNNGLSHFRHLQVLVQPFTRTSVDTTVLKFFVKLKKLVIWSQEAKFPLATIVDCIVSPDFEYLGIVGSEKKLNRDTLSSLARLPTLKTLDVRKNEVLQGIEQIITVLKKSCKNLKKIVIQGKVNTM